MTQGTTIPALAMGAIRAKRVVLDVGDNVVTVRDENEQPIREHDLVTISLVQAPTPTGMFIVSAARGRFTYHVEPSWADVLRSLFVVDGMAPGEQPGGGLPTRVTDPFDEDELVGPRWQYAVINLGIFNSVDRMKEVLAYCGSRGWELVATMDKASNWWTGMEKGFLLLKRQVPEGHTPKRWCVTITGAK